jgi:hypothetical protein
MTPELLIGSSAAVLCVLQKLAAVKMAIRVECETQKEAAIDAQMDPGQLSRELNGQGSFTFAHFDALPEEVQRTALLEMLATLGLPQRAKRWLSIARVLDGREERSA